MLECVGANNALEADAQARYNYTHTSIKTASSCEVKLQESDEMNLPAFPPPWLMCKAIKVSITLLTLKVSRPRPQPVNIVNLRVQRSCRQYIRPYLQPLLRLQDATIDKVVSGKYKPMMWGVA